MLPYMTDVIKYLIIIIIIIAGGTRDELRASCLLAGTLLLEPHCQPF
jgi:hypothetical protein